MNGHHAVPPEAYQVRSFPTGRSAGRQAGVIGVCAAGFLVSMPFVMVMARPEDRAECLVAYCLGLVMSVSMTVWLTMIRRNSDAVVSPTGLLTHNWRREARFIPAHQITGLAVSATKRCAEVRYRDERGFARRRVIARDYRPIMLRVHPEAWGDLIEEICGQFGLRKEQADFLLIEWRAPEAAPRKVGSNYAHH